MNRTFSPHSLWARLLGRRPRLGWDAPLARRIFDSIALLARGERSRSLVVDPALWPGLQLPRCPPSLRVE